MSLPPFAAFSVLLCLSFLPPPASISGPDRKSAPATDRKAAPAAEPRWFKGNLHTHTLWSDGNHFPEMVAEWYRDHGYHFLALTDHDRLNTGRRWIPVSEANKRASRDIVQQYHDRYGDDWVETRTVGEERQVRLKPFSEVRALVDEPGKFLLVQGEEITDRFERKPIHINAFNIRERVEPRGGRSVVEVMGKNVAAIEDQGRRHDRRVLAQVNHPNFGFAITAEDLALATRNKFVEIYNGHPLTYPRGDSWHASTERMWDVANTLRLGELKLSPIYGVATDDAHEYQSDHPRAAAPGRGWVMVRNRRLTPEALIRSLEMGDFYASTGVTLRDVVYNPDDQTLKIEVEPEDGVTYSIAFIGTPRDYDPTRHPVKNSQGQPLPVTRKYSPDVGKTFRTVEGTSATYKLTGDELFVRATVTSSRNRPHAGPPGRIPEQAWTQPVGWEQ